MLERQSSVGQRKSCGHSLNLFLRLLRLIVLVFILAFGIVNLGSKLYYFPFSLGP